MPSRKVPALVEEQWDRLINCVCYVEMMRRPDLLTPEQAQELKRILWAMRPRKKGKRRSEWQPFSALLNVYIEDSGGNVSEACRALAGDDWESLYGWYYSPGNSGRRSLRSRVRGTRGSVSK